ncbi:hypothetical protein ACHAXN_001091 [Cyclotella atomus]
MTAKLRARIDQENDGVLGIQQAGGIRRYNSILSSNPKYLMYNLAKVSQRALVLDVESEDEDQVQEKREMDVEDITYVRKPNLACIIEESEAMTNHPKYTLQQVVLSRRFQLYAHRFGNAQYQRTLLYPTLRQPKELYSCPWLMQSSIVCGECKNEEHAVITEKQRTRDGHRFIIAADTQIGILMDGFAMDFPNWSQEIEISRKCVKQINSMKGRDRPLFVCVCGDLADTESSFWVLLPAGKR